MTHKHCFEAVDQTLKDILKFSSYNSENEPFGSLQTLMFLCVLSYALVFVRCNFKGELFFLCYAHRIFNKAALQQPFILIKRFQPKRSMVKKINHLEEKQLFLVVILDKFYLSSQKACQNQFIILWRYCQVLKLTKYMRLQLAIPD